MIKLNCLVSHDKHFYLKFTENSHNRCQDILFQNYSESEISSPLLRDTCSDLIFKLKLKIEKNK